MKELKQLLRVHDNKNPRNPRKNRTQQIQPLRFRRRSSKMRRTQHIRLTRQYPRMNLQRLQHQRLQHRNRRQFSLRIQFCRKCPDNRNVASSNQTNNVESKILRIRHSSRNTLHHEQRTLISLCPSLKSTLHPSVLRLSQSSSTPSSRQQRLAVREASF